MTSTLFKCILFNDYVNKISIFKILMKHEETAQSLKYSPDLRAPRTQIKCKVWRCVPLIPTLREVTSGEYLGYIAHLDQPNP